MGLLVVMGVLSDYLCCTRRGKEEGGSYVPVVIGVEVEGNEVNVCQVQDGAEVFPNAPSWTIKIPVVGSALR